MSVLAVALAALLGLASAAIATQRSDDPLATSRTEGRFSNPGPSPAELAMREFDTPTPVIIEPEKAVEFPDSPRIHSVAFSPDGKLLYVAIDGKSIDLWKAAVSAWKEILGILAALALAIAIMIVLRVRSRAQIPGQPHCRRCNYNVLSQAPRSVLRGRDRAPPAAGTFCPECGVDLHRRRPRRGRGTVRRVFLPVTAAAAIVIGYGVMLVAGLPRQGRASTWFTIFSERIDKWAERNQLDTLLDHKVQVSRILRMRSDDRAIIGTLAVRRGRMVGNLLVSPSGDRLVMPEGQRRLVCLSTRWGWSVASLDGVDLQPWYKEQGITRYDQAGDVYFSSLDRAAGRSEFIRWNPSRGSRQLLVSEPAYVFTNNAGQQSATLRRHAVVETDQGMQFLTAPEFMQAYQGKKYELCMYDEQGGDKRREILLPEQASPSSRPTVAGRSGRAFLAAGVSGLLGVDLQTGELLGVVRPGGMDVIQDELEIDAQGRVLFASGHSGILVRDLQLREWVARLRKPEPYIAPALVLSPDGRWLATTPFRSVNQTGPYIHAVVLYDLKPLQDYLAKAAPGEASAKPNRDNEP